MTLQDELVAEQQLIEEAKVNPEQFGVLYERYVDKIYSYVFHRINNAEVAQDIVAQTFFKVLEHLPRFQWKGYSISSWIYKIATNEIYQFYRNEKKVQIVDITEVAHLIAEKKDPHQFAALAEQEECVSEFLKKLPQRQQEVLVLRFIEGLSNQDIARVFERNEGAVRQLIFRALANLRKLIVKKENNSDRIINKIRAIFSF
ncbi:MAG: RNA polymerase sigma factor [bacterium]